MVLRQYLTEPSKYSGRGPGLGRLADARGRKAAGLVAFGALFAVYAVSLKVTELSTVTFGSIVTLQVGLILAPNGSP